MASINWDNFQASSALGPTFVETATSPIIVLGRSESWHGIGGVERILALWSGSGDILQSPQVLDPLWDGFSDVRSSTTFDNIGRPGQTYQVGPSRRNTTFATGHTQKVGSVVTLTS